MPALGVPDPVVSVDEARMHLRVDGDDENTYIAGLTATATEFLNGKRGTLGRVFARQAWSETYGELGQSISLPIGPIISVDSITYDGGEITDFQLSESGGAWTVTPSAGASWPSVSGDVVVQFTVGLNPIPAPIKMAVLLHVGTLYENRESVVIGTISGLLPNGYHALLAPYRRWSV